MTDNATIQARISALSPTDFENLVYDCARAIGVTNLVWRTPGADGGRDIEGEVAFVDPTGFETRQRWYIECKKYSTSIDWPTVWNKLAYADSNGADYLLVATNSNPSPKCETEVQEWNEHKRQPQVRFWRGYDLPRLLRENLNIGRAHGIIDPIVGVSSDGIDLSLLITKLVQAAWAAQTFGQDPAIPLETAAALTELLSQRLAELQTHGRFTVSQTTNSFPDYDWLTTDGNLTDWEDVSVRALLCVVRLVCQSKALYAIGNGKTISVKLNGEHVVALKGQSAFLNVVLFWSRSEMTIGAEGEFLVLAQHKTG